VSDWTSSAKHLPGAGGGYAQWAAGVDIRATVASALRSASAKFLPDAKYADRIDVVTDVGETVGSKGETAVKVVIDKLGHIITAYPSK